MDIWRLIVGVVLVLIGLGWTAVIILLALDGDEGDGPFGGWLYLLIGLAIAIAGVFIIF
jgi:hypothetical protein